MKYVSTRGGIAPVSLEVAIAAGLAADGGLYVPERIPVVDLAFEQAKLAQTAQRVLAPYFVGSDLLEHLPQLCEAAFDFPAPLRALNGADDYLLELFHGPTAAFKDYAARFLAQTLARLRKSPAPITTVLVATSGDTGAAVAAAFHRRPGFRVLVLYPDGRVSPRQAHVLGSFGDNVEALRVDGSFDACQRLVKEALVDVSVRRQLALTSANSISLGRLLPQMAYYAHTALGFHARHGTRLNFIVPTGNLGNALACWLARRMGLPVGRIVLGCNANDALPRYLDGADYAPRATEATLANAMDVGAPSNFERLRWWHPSDVELRAGLRAFRVDDTAIGDAIARAPRRHGVVPCPHTAVGLQVLERLRATGDTDAWAVVATAHPAKFDSVVEPLVGHVVEPPAALVATLARPSRAQPLAADYAALRDHLLRGVDA